ncbi:uncharacterized protein LOC121880477 isoform X2 [Homarus americanus]|uniref:uncharacterized protein LOC121880477 isoform X2 n=1 Tax=Homarus americanus TaxID=6706 RepID=UPI001C4705DB|nr:uncharacterized protein LOC121880477 isoform X2 [Homarus americanus]
MQPPPLAQFSPLHMGRSFICYRDVNKAIERHREIYGLRLVLKKATKLENYCLTLDQMRDLNFRLKYGELDYQCSVDNGRPGRPGNDERCPRLVRLRLSPDARTLMVYDTHFHEPQPKSSGQFQSLSPPCPVPEPVTIISPEAIVSISPTLQLPSTPSTPCLPLPASSVGITTPDGSHTPNSVAGYEKITVKIKKSQFSPNEMVVVGSARDAQEQFELRNSPEKVPSQSNTPSPNIIHKTLPKPWTKELAQKFQESVSATKVVRKPPGKPAEKVITKPVEKITGRPGEKLVTKPPERVVIKPSERVIVKPLERFTPTKVSDRSTSKPSDKISTKPRQNERSAGRVALKHHQRTTEKGQKNGGIVSSTSGNGSSSMGLGVRSVNGSNKRLYKKRKSAQSEPTWDLSQILPLDTELGFNEKQQLAHGVLLRLLRVTSQLPMIEFSHALDTLETLTDAYQLEQRVNLTISHDHEEESENLYHDDPYEVVDLVEEDNDRYCEYENGVSSTTADHRVAVTQVDGSIDDYFESELEASVSREQMEAEESSTSCETLLDEDGDHQTQRSDSVQMWKISMSSL